MIGPTNKIVKAAANAASSVGATVSAAASVGAAVEKTCIKTSDDYQVKRKITPETVNDAFDRLEKAQSRAFGLSAGTLGSYPAYDKAMKEVASIKEEIATMRKFAPEMVKQVEADRAEAKAAQRNGLFDGFLKAVGWAVAPLPMALHSLFGKKD